MPIYPEVTIDRKVYFETIEPEVFIESYTEEEPRYTERSGLILREVVYINFRDRLRWRQTGDCYSCGICDWNGFDDDGNPRIVEGYILQPGKRVGERFSLKDPIYDTRKDIPCTPDYVIDAQANAALIGVPYQCGLTFEWLRFED